jgi:hypothetical protein
LQHDSPQGLATQREQRLLFREGSLSLPHVFHHCTETLSGMQRNEHTLRESKNHLTGNKKNYGELSEENILLRVGNQIGAKEKEKNQKNIYSRNLRL